MSGSLNVNEMRGALTGYKNMKSTFTFFMFFQYNLSARFRLDVAVSFFFFLLFLSFGLSFCSVFLFLGFYIF